MTHRLRGIFQIIALSSVLCATSENDARSQQSAVTLRGIVLEQGSSAALVGAHVILEGTVRLGTVTGRDGTFVVEDVPRGRYTLTVSFVGFRTYEQAGVVVETPALAPLTIRLEESDLRVNPVTVTASRRSERSLGAPSSVTVLAARQIEGRTALTAAEHLKDAPAVDLITTGLASSRVVIRGFNDNLASSLLTLVDHRIARVPSVRLTALQLIPISPGDIEQIEVVSGPASALYGPNAANGVVHVISRSALSDPGTSVSLAGGERDVMMGSFRHAAIPRRNLAYKVSGQYYSGTDFEFFDPHEIAARELALSSGASADTLRIGSRDFGVRNLAMNAAIEWRPSEDLSAVFSAGTTRGTNIEITPTGAAQVNGARLGFLQARLRYQDLFVQAYANRMNSGESFFLRTGEGFVDRSKLWAVQAQHRATLGRDHSLTYGTDLFYTQPDGDGTVNGRYEDSDEILEAGAYAQSESDLTAQVSLTLAARVDYHDRQDVFAFSPRAALLYRPAPAHTLRLTFNRAFRTPRANDLFSDVLGLRDAFTLGRMEDLLGFAPTTDLRVQGMLGGFTFDRDDRNLPYFHSPFAPAAGMSVFEPIALHDPAFSATMWDIVRQSAVAGVASTLAEQGRLSASDAAAVSQALDQVLPSAIAGLENQIRTLDLESQAFLPVDGLADAPALKNTRIETVEAGYKGLVAGALVVGVDLYWTRVRNFVGPFSVGTPNVFIADAFALSDALRPAIEEALLDPAYSDAADALRLLDGSLGGRNGSGVDEAAFLAGQVGGAIPFGTISPREAFDPTALILMRRNFGDVSLWGADLSAALFLSRRMQIGVNLAGVSKNYFEDVDGVDDIALNAPRLKGGGFIQYDSTNERLGFQARWRSVGGYRVRSDVYIGEVSRFNVFDMAVSWRPPFLLDTRFTMTIQNILNNEHREFVNVAEIGRLAMLRVTHDL